LANKNLVNKYYADLLGSSINQNGGRSAIISAPNPEAQEDLINDACRDAAIKPQDISYLECHGTGTKIGDPIEISAIQRTIANDRKQKCFLGAVKSNIGHLESAAGIAGLIKSVLILYHGIIPPNLHFNQPNQYIDFESYNLEVATEETKIEQQTHIGISSFGFGGTNAHIIIKGVDDQVRKNIENIEVPFDRTRSSILGDYYQLDHLNFDRNGIELYSSSKSKIIAENADAEIQISKDSNNKLSREEVRNLIQGLFFKVTNIESIDPDVELIEQGLDSMSITEFISQLQSSLEIDIDPDLIFEHPLPDQLIDEIHALI
jgi:acyl carrier protein